MWGFAPSKFRTWISVIAFALGFSLFGIPIIWNTLISFVVLVFVMAFLVFLGLLPKVLRKKKKTADLEEGDIVALTWVEADKSGVMWAPMRNTSPRFNTT